MSDRLEIVDVEMIEGSRSFGDEPTIIMPASTAERAIRHGQLEPLVKQALAALLLSGQNIVYVQAHDD